MKHCLKFIAALLCPLLLLCGCGSAAAPEDPDPGTELEVYCFSAGKADAFLLSTRQSAVLIDCGEKGFGKEILSYLEETGIDTLDYLIVTHFDKDHVGGAAKIISSIPVGTVLQSNRPKDSDEYGKYLKALGNAGIEAVTVREALSFTLDGVTYTVDPPDKGDYKHDDSNNSSLIVSVKNGQNSLLFAGDAQDERLGEFLSRNGTEYDFLKTPYHGHWQESLPALVESVRPAYAVITSSEVVPEDAETLSMLADAGTEVFLTRLGAVVVHCDGTAIQIEYADAQTDMAA